MTSQYLTPNSLSRYVLELSGIFIITFSFSLSYYYVNQSIVTDDLTLASTNIQNTSDTSKHYVAYSNQVDESVPANLVLTNKNSSYPVKTNVDDIDAISEQSRSDHDYVASIDASRIVAQSVHNDNQNDVNYSRNFAVVSSSGTNDNSAQTSSISSNSILSTSAGASTITSSAENVNSSSFTQINSLSEDNELFDSSLSDNLNVLSNSSAHGPIECPPIENFPVSMQSGAIAIQRAKGCPI